MKRLPVLLFLSLISVCTLTNTAGAAATSNSYDAGLRALSQGKTQQAVELLSQAINAHPNDHRYYNDRGVAYKRAGNLEMALADYSKALQLKPDYTNALNNRGVLYLEQGTYDRALQDFTEALKLGGLESKLLTNVGMAKAKLGDHRAAVADLEKALSYKPVDNRSYFYLAESLEHMGEKERALKMYQTALGVARDATSRDETEKRIFQLEKSLSSPNKLQSSIEPSRYDAAPDKRHHETIAAQVQGGPKRAPQTREIVRAAPLPPDASIVLKKASPESLIATPDELDERCRARALGKYSSNAAEIYRQGVQFVAKSDFPKALIRFEDSRNLERRSKNVHAFAWSDLEIGRVHSRLGDHTKAASYLQEALSHFTKLKAGDEALLALIELAANQKAMGQKEKASSFYAKALEEAVSGGHSVLTKAIQDLSAGRPLSVERRKAVAEEPKPTEGTRPEQKAGAKSSAPASVAAAESRKMPAAPEHKPSQVVTAPTGKPVAQKEGKEAAPAEASSSQTRPMGKLDGVGSGPVGWKDTGRVIKPARPITQARDRVAGETPKTAAQQNVTQPERVVLWAKGASPSEKTVSSKNGTGVNRAGDGTPGVEPSAAGKFPGAPKAAKAARRSPSENRAAAERKTIEKLIRDDLTELRKLKNANDEPGLVGVLERLADRYTQTGQYEKALHGLTASLALREKVGLNTGKKLILYHSGIIKEKLGQHTEALEETTRALALPDGKDKSLDKRLESAAAALASGVGVPVDATLQAFAVLWKARAENDTHGETQALCLIAGIYEKANRYSEALNYYDRASASILADKSRVYEKIGKSQMAEQALSQALDAFRKLDYSRYMNMVRKSRISSTLMQ